MKLVPDDATDAMLKAGGVAFYGSKEDVLAARLPAVYHAMLAAAPEANSRLIPDMLEALKVAMSTMHDFDEGDQSSETGWKHDELCDAWMQCHAAIAKAEQP